MKFVLLSLSLASILALVSCSTSNCVCRSECRNNEAKIMKDSKDPLVRRSAFRCRLLNDRNREAVIRDGLADRDEVIRGRAVYEIFILKGSNAAPELARMTRDPSEFVMSAVISCAKKMDKKNAADALIRKIADESTVPAVKREAKKLHGFKFYRETRLLRNNPTFDHDIQLVKTVALPVKSGWRIMTDPDASGHEKGYFKVDLNDSKWTNIGVSKCWEEQGLKNYDGIAWYRIKFKMPPKIDCNGVEFAFGAVDEEAWIWLNGIYLGQHTLGPSGWNVPFRIDATKEIKWGAENTLVVRVDDSTMAGGIWKPVTIEILK